MCALFEPVSLQINSREILNVDGKMFSLKPYKVTAACYFNLLDSYVHCWSFNCIYDIQSFPYKWSCTDQSVIQLINTSFKIMAWSSKWQCVLSFHFFIFVSSIDARKRRKLIQAAVLLWSIGKPFLLNYSFEALYNSIFPFLFIFLLFAIDRMMIFYLCFGINADDKNGNGDCLIF